MYTDRSTPAAVISARALFANSAFLFFLSGATGLAYQVLWFKRFAQVWGSSTLAMAAVVTSFLLGLGLGAHLLGGVADRLRKPIAWYGVFELVIGVLALLVPFAITWMRHLAAATTGSIHDLPVLMFTVRAVLTFLVIGPACMLMGGTLPLLVRQCTPRYSDSTATGWLYGLNTLGAAAGCYLVGFHLLPAIGLYWTNNGVAALNGLIGLWALALASRAGHLGSTAENATRPSLTRSSLWEMSAARSRRAATASARQPQLLAIYAVAALTGFAALVLEMTWARQLSILVGGSTYAFSAMLFVVLIGIGAGSLIYQVSLARSRSLSAAMVTVVLVLTATTVLGKVSIPMLTQIFGAIRELRSNPLLNAAVCTGAAAILELLPSLAMGILFPLMVQLARRRALGVGQSVGTIYALNTIGSLLGGTLASSLLIPWVGTEATIALAVAVYLVAALLLVPLYRRIVPMVAYTAVAACLVFAAYRPQDPHITNYGMVFYGVPTGEERERLSTLAFSEGPTSSVLVAQDGDLVTLRVNGKVDASTGRDMQTQLGSAYLPRFLCPDARKVLVVGFGSGVTPGAALQFPDTHVTCCEIEPRVFEASKYFHEVNHRPEEHPNFRIVFDDARGFLMRTREKYDLIISEPSNPWIAGIASLFTKEFYQTVRQRLNDGGLCVQWLQTYDITTSEYTLILRTLKEVFPDVAILETTPGDTLILASMRPIAPTAERLDALQAQVDRLPAVTGDLQQVLETSDVRRLLMTHYRLVEADVNRMLAMHPGDQVNTDLNLRLEFDAPGHLYDTTITAEQDVDLAIDRATTAEGLLGLFRSWQCGAEQVPALKHKIGRFLQTHRSDLVAALVEEALRHTPDDPVLLAERLLHSSSLSQEEFSRSLARLAERSLPQTRRLGVRLWEKGQNKRAVETFKLLVKLQPEAASAWTDLGINYEALGDLEAAEAAHRRAFELDPVSIFTQKAKNAFRDKRQNHRQQTGATP